MESSFPNFSQSLSLHRLSAQRTFQAMTNYPIIWRSSRISKWIEFQTHSLADVHADCVNKANQKHFRKSTMAINESMEISKWMREKNQHIFPIVIAICSKCVCVCKKKNDHSLWFIFDIHVYLWFSFFSPRLSHSSISASDCNFRYEAVHCIVMIYFYSTGLCLVSPEYYSNGSFMVDLVFFILGHLLWSAFVECNLCI